MDFIRNKKERIDEFYKLWDKEIKINPKYYKLVHGNDILFIKGISKDNIVEVLDFCDKFHKKFKCLCNMEDNKILADEIYKKIDIGGMFLLKHLFEYD